MNTKTLTQKEKIIALLKDAGSQGVNSFDITFKHRIKQGPTRIHELKKQGYRIGSKSLRNGSTTYYLIEGPAESKTVSKANVAPQVMEWHFDKDGRAWKELLRGPEQGGLFS